MTVTGGVLSPDGKWIAINATRQYEHEHQPYDIWLLSADGTNLLRVTGAPPQDSSVHWSPDGTRLFFLRTGVGLVTLSLDTGILTPIGIDSGFNFASGGAK
jgi:Tol biopolymer transport system component